MPIARLDDEVFEQLKKRAVEEGLVFGSPNDVLRVILGLNYSVEGTATEAPRVPMRSRVPTVQILIDTLVPRLLDFAEELTFEKSKTGRWVGKPDNFVAITVQDARNRDLAIYVYGNPEKFQDLKVALPLRRSHGGSYTRFNLKRVEQVPDALTVIRRGLDLKRGGGQYKAAG